MQNKELSLAKHLQTLQLIQFSMKLMHTLIVLLFLPFIGNGQQLALVTPITDSIKETSGLIYLNQKIITHNDSAGQPVLYELDSTSGSITRKVFVSNAINIDWEDICHDDTYIYIADMGNNNGTRTNLKIYRVSILDYLTSVNDTVTAETIEFNYSDQTDFTPNQFGTNFDAEALISWNDSLYIFTKNWGNNWTNIYALPKTIDAHQIDKLDSINSQGLITGATFNQLSNTIMLSGYTFSEPFILAISDITSNQFSSGSIIRQIVQMPAGFSYQIEGVLFTDQNKYYLTSEESFSGSPGLYRLDYDPSLSIEELEKASCTIYPNPASNLLHIDSDDGSTIEIYDMNGNLKKTTKETEINISDLSKGNYLILIKSSNGVPTLSRKLIVN